MENGPVSKDTATAQHMGAFTQHTQPKLLRAQLAQGQLAVSHRAPTLAKALGALPPAEDTLVGTGQAGGGLHAAVALNAIEGVLVAAPAAPQHRLRVGKHSTRVKNPSAAKLRTGEHTHTPPPTNHKSQIPPLEPN